MENKKTSEKVLAQILRYCARRSTSPPHLADELRVDSERIEQSLEREFDDNRVFIERNAFEDEAAEAT